MDFWKKFNSYFDKNLSKIIWIVLAIQTLIIAIYSYN